MSIKLPKIFYGWWVVGASFMIALFVGGVIHYGFTAMFEPIANEFHWSYAQISLGASLRGLETGLLAPFIGILVDRLGPRKLLFSGIIIIGVGLMVLSSINSLGMFYGAFILIGIGMSTCSSTVLLTTVANWFRKKMSMAIGIVLSGWGFAGLLIPLVVILINIFQWRTALVIIGISVWVIGLPLSLLVRHRPEQYGYLADGEVNRIAIDAKDPTSVQTTEESSGAKQALRSGTFWQIVIALMFRSTIVAAVTTHVMPFLTSIGIARTMSGLVASAVPLSSISGRLGFGWLGDRFDKRWVSASGFAVTSLGLLFFAYSSVERVWLLVPFLIFFGIGYGGLNVMIAGLLRDYFGRNKFSTIFGFAAGVLTVGQVIGPLLAGWVYDKWGSYQGIWLVFAGLSFCSLVLITTISRPHLNSTGR